jgi:hypothetical protein
MDPAMQATEAKPAIAADPSLATPRNGASQPAPTTLQQVAKPVG